MSRFFAQPIKKMVRLQSFSKKQKNNNEHKQETN
jgi:hypothetical protein